MGHNGIITDTLRVKQTYPCSDDENRRVSFCPFRLSATI